MGVSGESCTSAGWSQSSDGGALRIERRDRQGEERGKRKKAAHQRVLLPVAARQLATPSKKQAPTPESWGWRSGTGGDSVGGGGQGEAQFGELELAAGEEQAVAIVHPAGFAARAEQVLDAFLGGDQAALRVVAIAY